MNKSTPRFINSIAKMVFSSFFGCVTCLIASNAQAIVTGPFTEPGVSAAAITNWATSVVDYSPGDGTVSPPTNNGLSFNIPTESLGPANGGFGVVSLGELNATDIANSVAPGSITLSFSGRIVNGSGADFAVFENAFTFIDDNGTPENTDDVEWTFSEFAYVEVSTDGNTFARFPSVSLTIENDPDSFYTNFGRDFTGIQPENIFNLAGKHPSSPFTSLLGTPFDLEDLASDPNVIGGSVDLDDIQFVRVVDVPGDGSFEDSTGNPIYDSWNTIPVPTPSFPDPSYAAGFDLDAIGVIHHEVPEPSSLVICLLALTCWLWKNSITRQ